ncbi:protein MIS12 homolog isoform X2 [Tasmannia lanceolata]|uniref:protein MIS12 homolog isoform X2 n=1 Tax=Tasmannia lanceolata TaxID=3420 RepID=UPI0040628ABC
MEGGEREMIFSPFNLNPQLFINEVLKAVDDMVDGAFEFYEQEALELLKKRGIDMSNELSQGVSCLRHLIQGVLDKRLDMWEKYCLRHCFAVPEGFSLPQADPSSNNLLFQDGLCDGELDAELDSLREKLAVAGRESAELHRELQALEKHTTLSSHCAQSVTEALELFDQNSMFDMFQADLLNHGDMLEYPTCTTIRRMWG